MSNFNNVRDFKPLPLNRHEDSTDSNPSPCHEIRIYSSPGDSDSMCSFDMPEYSISEGSTTMLSRSAIVQPNFMLLQASTGQPLRKKRRAPEPPVGMKNKFPSSDDLTTLKKDAQRLPFHHQTRSFDKDHDSFPTRKISDSWSDLFLRNMSREDKQISESLSSPNSPRHGKVSDSNLLQISPRLGIRVFMSKLRSPKIVRKTSKHSRDESENKNPRRRRKATVEPPLTPMDYHFVILCMDWDKE
ncbi:hypothetical protein ACJMK2_028487, partial [Sinanodonta woodiana]